MVILSLYNLIICVVAAVLHVAVNKLEPIRRICAKARNRRCSCCGNPRSFND